MVNYVERLRCTLGTRYSPHTIRAFCANGTRFLKAVGQKPAYQKQDLIGYVDSLVRHGYKVRSISTMLAGVHAMFTANDLRWPLTRQDLHLGLPEDDEGGPTLSEGEVAAIVRGARRQQGLVATCCCLSTVYGLRPNETARAITAGLDGKVLVIQTAKLGKKRTHQIPGGLAGWLTCQPTPCSTSTLHRLFEALMRQYCREPRPHEGWHAVRRALVTGLWNRKLEEVSINKWFGWKHRQPISERYYRPDPALLDQEVYGKHPFLRLWGEEKR